MLIMGASIIGLFLSSCQKPMAVSDVQGAWVAKQASQQNWIKGTNRCQMVLQSDGTFTASVPDYLMMTFDKASGKVISGKGQWNLESPRALAPCEIKFNFSEVDGKQVHWGSKDLQTERGNQGVELFFYIGEEGGLRFVFERAPSQAAEK
jgi:hypothetical protein